MQRLALLISFVLAALHCAQAGALTLRLCTDEHSHLPYITPTGEGTADLLIREAAHEAGITVEFHAAPITRCREEIRVNAADGFPTTPYTPSIMGFVAFPMNGGDIDVSKAISTTRSMVFRRTGSAAQWDGERFMQLTTSVLVPFGSVLLLDRLKGMNVAIDDSGKTLGANFAKMLAGRADLAVGSEYSGRALMAQPQFAGKVEVLAVPFTDEPYYLGVSKRFHDAHPAAVQKLWDAIARIRRTPAYQARLRKALEESARTLKE